MKTEVTQMTFKQLVKSLSLSNNTWQRCLDFQIDLVWEGAMNMDEVDWRELRDDSATSEQWQALYDSIANQEW